MIDACSPGSHPHHDRPNWSPASTIEDYLANCRDGTEDFTESRALDLLGWSRMKLQRVRLMAKIPDALFDRLWDHCRKRGQIPSYKAMAAIGAALAKGKTATSCECCPHCGGVLRVRSSVPADLLKVVNDWLAEARS